MVFFVLAYGALQPGQRLHHIIRGAHLVDPSGFTNRTCFHFDPKTDLGASIVDKDDIFGRGGSLVGHVYQVSPGLIMRLDEVERPLRRALEYVHVKDGRILLAWVYYEH